MIKILAEDNSLFQEYMCQLRDVDIQKDSMRFRKNLERIGQLMAYEISKTLSYSDTIVTTPLGEAKCKRLSSQPVIGTILRAGLPMHYGMLNYFDGAENAFITAFRKEEEEGKLQVQIDYLASPELEGKDFILCDPMLATGSTMHLVYDQLIKKRGKPRSTHLVSAIASRTALEYMKDELGSEVNLWVGVVDEGLNDKSYIVPGLGDAGDLSFGVKL